ncbi:MAG: ModD protein [Campylobacterales bacterium]|nr:ModD protein [Campylobacterales bacterium]
MRLSQTDLQQLLDEDIPMGDLTTRLLGIGAKAAKLTIVCRRASMVLACMDEAQRLCMLGGLHVAYAAQEGARLSEGEVLLRAKGDAHSVHAVWKMTQNLLDFACGIATYTRDMVDAAREVNAQIVVATTRKTPPFAKKIAIKAVESGGGVAHRLGLSETVLVFEEHRAFFSNDAELEAALLHVKRHAPEKPLVIEVHSLEEAQKFARMGADILQLEKFPIERLRQSVQALQTEFVHLKLIATGGITLQNVREYAACGADIIVTSAPYGAPSSDVKVYIEAL